jgi:hypothetical protein
MIPVMKRARDWSSGIWSSILQVFTLKPPLSLSLMTLTSTQETETAEGQKQELVSRRKNSIPKDEHTPANVRQLVTLSSIPLFTSISVSLSPLGLRRSHVPLWDPNSLGGQ